ncbi:MAG TPA: 16S rRNA (cytosine(1402)-N(4))-methyltransferase RsmH, partial [Pirellulales bacterium]
MRRADGFLRGNPAATVTRGRKDAPPLYRLPHFASVVGMSPPLHVPVMLDEIVEQLAPKPGAVLVDGTLGGGGYTRALAERVAPNGIVLALDRDPGAIAMAEQNLAGLPVMLAQSNFADLPDVLEEAKLGRVNGVVLDLGLSSIQLADRERGFSFESPGPLDMRFDTTEGEPTWKTLERLSVETIADVIYRYGEETSSRKIARAIVDRRRDNPVRTAIELAELVRKIAAKPGRDRIDPATRTFQALRICVNRELESLERILKVLPDVLVPGGRAVIVSFHSLEDRLVKD